MSFSPDRRPSHHTPDYTEYDGELEGAKIVEIRGRYPEAGTKLAEVALRVIHLEGFGKLFEGPNAKILGPEGGQIAEGHHFSLEGNQLKVIILPKPQSLLEKSSPGEGADY